MQYDRMDREVFMSVERTSTGDPLSELERAFMAEFLQDRGHTLETVRMLPPAEARALLQQASVYASCRLTEVESRAHFVDDMHRRPRDS
jgi:uncharacterized protein YbaP (TraB family)